MGCVYILGYLHWQGYQHLAVFCVRTQEVCFVDCTLPRPLEPRSQTLIPRSHGASFPNSHTQTTWSLIPRLSFPNSHTQTTWSLIPRLSYPNSHTQTPRSLVPKLSLTSVLFSIILPWLQAFIGVTRFYSSRPLLCDSQTPISRPHRASFPNSHSQTPIPRPHRALLFPSTVLCTSSKRFGIQKSASLLWWHHFLYLSIWWVRQHANTLDN